MSMETLSHSQHTQTQTLLQLRQFKLIHGFSLVCRGKAQCRKADSKTVGCGEKITGLLNHEQKCSPTNINYKPAGMSDISKVI